MIVSTDPPYYDNIQYADLSDFFYVWMRKTLQNIYPEIFSTMAVPKTEELVASTFRHKNKQSAEEFFMRGIKKSFKNIISQTHQAYPITIYYAFKQDANSASIGWETFLEAIIKAGIVITAHGQ